VGVLCRAFDFAFGRCFTKKTGFGNSKIEKAFLMGQNKNQPP
jgi:hypothetical protein